jgi:hypothetical protein
VIINQLKREEMWKLPLTNILKRSMREHLNKEFKEENKGNK